MVTASTPPLTREVGPVHNRNVPVARAELSDIVDRSAAVHQGLAKKDISAIAEVLP
jgi:hypothetical protein